MADIQSVLKAIAPTVASALLGPLGGAAVSALGGIFGVSSATQDTIASVITNAQMTPDQVGKLKELELQYQNEEKERGFRYAELVFQDRDSARKANVAGATQLPLFWLSLAILFITIGSEVVVLFFGYPADLQDIVVGRILGLLDSVSMMVLAYWYGTSSGSAQKSELLAQAQPIPQKP